MLNKESLIFAKMDLNSKNETKRLNGLRVVSEHYQDIKEMRKKKERLKTIKKHVVFNKLNWYITITLDDEKKTQDIKLVNQSLKKILYRNEIKFFLIPEYSQSGRLHYHGFISDNDYMVNTGHFKRGKPVYHCSLLNKNYGFSYAVDVGKNLRTMRYVSKYSVKNGVRSIYSRCVLTPADKIAINLFGINLILKE